MLRQRTPLIRKSPMKRSPIKPSAPKMTPAKRSKSKRRPGQVLVLRDVCRGEGCYLQIPGVCRGAAGAETVVPAHGNESRYGKALGLKAHDFYTVPACFWCHSELDQGSRMNQIEKITVFAAALERWIPARAAKLLAIGKPVPAAPNLSIRSAA